MTHSQPLSHCLQLSSLIDQDNDAARRIRKDVALLLETQS